MLLKFLRFPECVFTPHKSVFLSLLAGAGNWYLHYYRGNATFKNKLILKVPTLKYFLV